LHALSNYEALLRIALQTGYITEKDVEILTVWKQSPETWHRNE
jgi:orotate phosphoribosyltransferase